MSQSFCCICVCRRSHRLVSSEAAGLLLPDGRLSPLLSSLTILAIFTTTRGNAEQDGRLRHGSTRRGQRRRQWGQVPLGRPRCSFGRPLARPSARGQRDRLEASNGQLRAREVRQTQRPISLQVAILARRWQRLVLEEGRPRPIPPEGPPTSPSPWTQRERGPEAEASRTYRRIADCHLPSALRRRPRLPPRTCSAASVCRSAPATLTSRTSSLDTARSRRPSLFTIRG